MRICSLNWIPKSNYYFFCFAAGLSDLATKCDPALSSEQFIESQMRKEINVYSDGFIKIFKIMASLEIILQSNINILLMYVGKCNRVAI